MHCFTETVAVEPPEPLIVEIEPEPAEPEMSAEAVIAPVPDEVGSTFGSTFGPGL
jgi:hypothetical protein